MDTTNQIDVSSEHGSTKSRIFSRWLPILTAAAIVLGIFFRTAGLGNKIYSHDEVYTSLYAAGHRTGYVFTSLWDGKDKTVEDIQFFLKPNRDNDIVEVLSLLALYSPHQAPLFFALEHAWMEFIGYTPAAMRALAALFGCLSILAMYWLGKELFQSLHPALLCAALFAISPFHILFAQDARPYSLWTLLTLLSSAALLRAMRKSNTRAWMVYSLTLILGMYSHQLFSLVALVHGFYFTGMQFINRTKMYGGFFLACLAALLLYTPWLYFAITRWQQAAAQVDVLTMQIPWYRYIQRWILLFSSPLIDLDFNSNSANLVPYLLRVLLLAFVAYALLILFKHGSHQEKLFILLTYLIAAGTFIVVDLLFGGMRSITGRYFVPVNIATILVVAQFLANRLDQARPGIEIRWRIVTGVLITASLFSNVNILLAETWWNKELGRVRTEFVHEISREQTLLIVSGIHPTNVGDVLLLSLEVNPAVHFRLYQDPADVRYADDYQNIYWFPSTYEEVQAISKREGLQIREVLAGALWQIEGKVE